MYQEGTHQKYEEQVEKDCVPKRDLHHIATSVQLLLSILDHFQQHHMSKANFEVHMKHLKVMVTRD